MNAYLIYAAFFVSLWSGDLRTGKSVVVGCVLLFMAEVLAVVFVCLFRQESLGGHAPISADSSG